MAICSNWAYGDDEPLAEEWSEAEMAEVAELEREADALNLQAEDWKASREDDDDGD
jgi:hypothetical protein